MSYVKKSPNLFLGEAELGRMSKFVDDDGVKEIIKREAVSFGLVNNQIDNTFSNGLVGVGTNPVVPSYGYIKINELFAIDKDALFIRRPFSDNFAIPNNGNWYWIKITQAYSPKELGTVSIAPNGTLTGVGTEFTKILRGRPNFPSKIKFYGSTYNTGEYEVVNVTSDTTALLTGTNFFTNETLLEFSVVGTFTPGTTPTTLQKEPFQYDSCTLTLVLETLANTKPAYTLGKDFFLARVRVTGGTTVEIQDKRESIFELKSTYTQRDFLLPIKNKVAGISAIKYNHYTSSRDHNIIYFDWAFKAYNWVLDTNTNKVTIQGGEGGRFKDCTYFTNGDFDGWRVYTTNGKFSRVTSSVKSGSNINLTLDYLNTDDFILGTTLMVTPNAEEIEIYLSSAGLELPDVRMVFPINMEQQGKIPAMVYNGNGTVSAGTGTIYYLEYRYKTLNHYSLPEVPYADTVGYYNEDQWDTGGLLNVSPVPTRTTYDSTTYLYYLGLKENTNSYYNVISTVVTGDLFGVNSVTLTNSAPLLQLYVGTNKEYQYYNGSTLTLSTDMYINLNKLSLAGAALRDGNFFLLHFKQKVTPVTFKLRVVQDYLNTGSWTLVKEFFSSDWEFINNGSEQGVYLRCTWSTALGRWIITNTNESKITNHIETTTTVSTSSGTWAAFAGHTFTTPNDGKTRRYMIMAKSNLEYNNGGGGQRNGGEISIYDFTNSVFLDLSSSAIQLTSPSVTVANYTQSLTCMKIILIGPNITITHRYRSLNGNMDFKYNKFEVVEIN